MQMQQQRGEMAPPEALAARRLDFTRLHVAVEVPRHVLEPCANYQPHYMAPSHALTRPYNPSQVLQRVLELCASATAP